MSEIAANAVIAEAPDREVPLWSYALGFLAVAAVAVLVRFAVLAPADADEIEHAHAAWLVATGHRPYLDFHQLHMPLVWLVAAPVAAIVQTPSLLIVALRLLCIAALLGALAFAYAATAGALAPRERWIATSVATIWAAAFAVASEFFRFRPDPFMATALMGAVATYARPGTASLRRHGIAGFWLGLAAAFSPKMLPVILLAPVIAALDMTGPRRFARVVAACAAAAAGAAIVPLLVVAGLVVTGLLERFLYWVVTLNGTTLNAGGPPMTKIQLVTVLTTLGATMIVGVGAATWRWWRCGRDAARPLLVASLAATLGALVPVVEPNHLNYNYQAGLVPAGLTLGLAVAMLTGLPGRRSWRSMAAVVSLLMFCAVPVRDNLKLRIRGPMSHLIATATLDKLSRCGDWSRDTCVGFAPYHPMSCPDATALTMEWDYGFLTDYFSIPESSRVIYAAMWNNAISRMIAAPPALVVRPDYFKRVLDRGRLDASRYAALQHLFADHYRQSRVDGIEVMVRNDRVACLDP